jgi:hypothetical protein
MNRDEVGEVINELEGEVNNGGFHQYFNNYSGGNAAEALIALETIGALRMADILKRAIGRFPAGNVPKDRESRLEILSNVFPNTDEFNDLDDEFFTYPDDIAALVEKYKTET